MKRIAEVACAGVLCGVLVACVGGGWAQGRPQDVATIARRNAIEKELESIAIIERKVMVPMRDGKRIQADVYRPKDESKKYPIILCAHLTTSITGMWSWARRGI